jgi:beta-galactosidase
VNGLDIQDLRDWAGSSNARPPHTPIPGQERRSALRWHWGNRGGVASAAIEKPHWPAGARFCTGEFDMAYSP